MNEIETDRLRLRMFTTEDLHDLSIIFGDPCVVRHIGTGRPVGTEETGHALHGIIKHWERHGFGRWAAVFKATGELIGYGGLRNFNGTPELVYLLSKSYWGLGLATEMARASLKFGFEEQNFERVIAMAKVANLASQRVMQKAGMAFEKRTVVSGIEVVRYYISRAAYLSGRAEHSGRAFLNEAAARSSSPAL